MGYYDIKLRYLGIKKAMIISLNDNKEMWVII